MIQNFITLLSILGLLNTGYLISCKIKKKDVLCLFFPKEWCKKVQYSKYSKTFGVPNAYLGFLMYALIFTMSLGFLTNYIWIPILGGLGFSLYFLYIQGFKLKAFCTWCVLSAIEFIIMGILLLFLF